jgi:L-ascorbate metabolism protein UlaG (beta-lactamase superfamily)
MNKPFALRATVLAVACVLSQAAYAKHPPPATADTIRVRQQFFGAENVDPRTGEVDKQKVIFSWTTNASYAVSVRGRIVLLDTYVHRAETVPGRTPFVVEDLVTLRPEAIFLGHGHGDHADNAAFVAGRLGIPIYASEETCGVMQVDASNLNAAGIIDVPTVDCHNVTSAGSTPGAEIVNIPQLEPDACITAFRHLHSTTTPPDTTMAIAPVINDADPRDATVYNGNPPMYPPGTPHSFPTSGGPGGPISIFYQFVVRGGNRFSFAWHNTTGALKEGCGLDKCWGPAVGQHLVDIMHSLPQTDVELGSSVSLGFPVNGMRDVVLYNEALLPKVFIPIHQTNAALPTSSLRFKIAYLQQLTQMVPPFPAELRPEARWMVDPNDFLKPLVYDPKSDRWDKPRQHGTVGGCG